MSIFKNSKRIVFMYIIVAIIFTFMITINYSQASNYEYPVKKTSDVLATDQSSISVSAVATPEFNFQSSAQVLMEPTTGKIIYANNENEKLRPASVTKIMSLILIMEQIDSGKLKYTDTVTCSADASKLGGSQIFFKEGEKLTIDEALKCIAITSANDVTYAMAELIGGTEANFVKMMNDKAKELGMNDTTFVNCHGLDADGHYTTAHDMALMSRELITKHPDIFKYTSIWMDSIRDGTFGLTNTNKLIRFYDGAIGLKTGSTSSAGFNLSAVAKKDNTMFIAVIMKGPSSDIRNEEAKQLLNYGFSNYEVKNVYDKDIEIQKVAVNKYVKSQVSVKTKSNVSMLITKGSNVETTEDIVYDKQLVAPILKDTVVGKIMIKDKSTGEELGSSELVITENINKSNIKDYFKHIVSKYIMKI